MNSLSSINPYPALNASKSIHVINLSANSYSSSCPFRLLIH